MENPSLEKKLYTKGQIRLQNYVIFETNRPQNGGGGLLTAVNEKFQPSLLETVNNNPDILIVQCKISNYDINLINGYGPQESETMEEKLKFFSCFETAIVNSKLNGNLICSQLDANSKIGLENLKSDPNNMSPNGQLLMEIVNRNNLIVVNSTSKCSGIITRIRKTSISEEKSVLDYFIVCESFFTLISRMEVDENRKYVLTKYSSRMGLPRIVESDHNLLICNLNIKWDSRVRKERKEVFKLKDKEGLIRFHEITSNCPKLVHMSEKSDNFLDDSEKWLKTIQDILHQSFKKVRITSKGEPKNEELNNLMKIKKELRQKLGKFRGQNTEFEEKIIENIRKIEEEISRICSGINSKIVKTHIEELTSGGDASELNRVNRLNMWRLKQRICPKNIEPPMAKKDADGKLISNPEKLKTLYLQTYQDRLRHRKIRADYEEVKNMKNLLFNMRLSLSKTRKSEPWGKQDLFKVLKTMKSGKSCDAIGYSNELFKPGVIGCDLVKSLLNIINRAKHESQIPRPFRLTKITSIYKSKGEKCDLQNDRGVHSVTKFRAIIDKLLYNDMYEQIDSKMSNCNVGGRRNRSIRDNLFVIYACINDATGYQKTDIDIQFYDITQCFDSMWYEETMNDLWESLDIRDDKFSLVSEMNKEVDIFVKTPVGDTEIFTLEKIEQQGTVLAPIKCSNQMDSISRECLKEKVEMFRYRNVISIPPLGMIDDLASVSYCGPKSVKLNAIINAKISLKKLELSQKKCVKLHISKEDRKRCDSENLRKCAFLKVEDNDMREEIEEKYIGDIVSASGSNDTNISRRRSIGMGAISDIFAILNEVSMGYQYIEIGLILREAVLMSKILLSAESWHRVSQCQIEKLEEIDNIFLRKLFNCHSKTAKEFIISESGTIPIRFQISGRRLLYWKHILSVDKSELIYRVYLAQKLSPVRGDWITLLEKDKDQFGINLSDEDVKIISKQKFKTFIKQKSTELKGNIDGEL